MTLRWLGTRFGLTRTRRVTCATCNGWGRIRYCTCPHCLGTGYRRVVIGRRSLR